MYTEKIQLNNNFKVSQLLISWKFHLIFWNIIPVDERQAFRLTFADQEISFSLRPVQLSVVRVVGPVQAPAKAKQGDKSKEHAMGSIAVFQIVRFVKTPADPHWAFW